MNKFTHILAGVATAALLAASPGKAQVSASEGDARPGILRALGGSWRMSGDVRGKPVTYTMSAAPALQGSFTEMRMKDVQVPARYEAAVFIAYDTASQALIARWMDNHGANASIPHATGRIAGLRPFLPPKPASSSDATC